MQSPMVAGGLIRILLDTGARKATKYLSERETVKASRRLFNGKISKRSNSVDIVVTIGAPNYEERDFIRKCKKAGEPFPVKRVILKFPPARRKGA